jgi:hypothetical protein
MYVCCSLSCVSTTGTPPSPYNNPRRCLCVCVCVAISHGCDVTGFWASENEAAGRCSWAMQQKDQRKGGHRCANCRVERAPLCASMDRSTSASHLHVQNSNAAGTTTYPATKESLSNNDCAAHLRHCSCCCKLLHEHIKGCHR